jgi:ElaB/YqjD/DUF883 family membrane-anchored ribosome-binding protein
MVRSTPGTDTIEDDIRATRRSIDDKVERIQRRLSPGDMVDSVVDFARTNGGAIAGGIGRGVRENPVPVALIGAGVLWLALSSRARHRADDEVIGDGGESTADKLRHKAADLGDNVRDGVRTGSRQVRQQAAALGQKTRDQAVRAGRSGERFVKEHPVLVGAAGIALGAAVAASLPRTGREDRAFGELADRVKTAAKDAAVKEGRKVQEAAKAAVAKARETAERKAPTAGDLKRDAEQSVRAAGGSQSASESSPRKAPGAAG